MDIGAILADDKMSYFLFCPEKKCYFVVAKRTVQCREDLNHKL